MTVWTDPPETSVPAALQEAVGGHPLVAEVLARRGFSQPGRRAGLPRPAPLHPRPARGLPRAGRGLPAHRARHRRTASASGCGAISTWTARPPPPCWSPPCAAWAPNRASTSRCARANRTASTSPTWREILAAGADLIITCDTGITAHEALAFAQQSGLDVIVTDHHALGGPCLPRWPASPRACCPPGHPLGPLPGVGVAYKLAEALLQPRRTRRRGRSPARPGRAGHRRRRGPADRRRALPAPARAGRAAPRRTHRPAGHHGAGRGQPGLAERGTHRLRHRPRA